MFSLIFIIINGIAKSISDTLAHHYDISIFNRMGQWWSQDSWKNKYDWSNGNKILSWLLQNPLVFITDAWHFFNMIGTFSLLLAIVTYKPLVNPVVDVFILLLTRSVIFHVFYHYIFVKRS